MDYDSIFIPSAVHFRELGIMMVVKKAISCCILLCLKLRPRGRLRQPAGAMQGVKLIVHKAPAPLHQDHPRSRTPEKMP